MDNTALVALRDIAGVYGSFLVSGEGECLAADLPSWMAGTPIEAVGARICRLRDTLESETSLEWCSIRFESHRLYLKPHHDSTLCVIGALGVDSAALRMASTLAARRLTGRTSLTPSSPGISSPSAVGSQPAAAGPQPTGPHAAIPPAPAPTAAPSASSAGALRAIEPRTVKVPGGGTSTSASPRARTFRGQRVDS